MASRIETSRAAFEHKLQELQAAVTKGSGVLIDKNLHCVKKSGLGWVFLCILRPFYALFGKDVYSHVRVNNVAEGVFKYCLANQRFFFESASLIQKIKNEILEPLNQKTSQKYQDVFKQTSKWIDFLKPRWSLSEWKWPSDISVLGLTEEHKRDMDHALSKMAAAIISDPNYGLEFQKTEKGSCTLIIKDSTPQSQKIKLPFSLFLKEGNNRLESIMLLTKKVIGKGGERSVKLCFNLTTGESFVKKGLGSNVEVQVSEWLKENSSRGIVPIEAFREVSLDADSAKIQVIEPLYNGTLDSLFKTPALADTIQKLSFMQDLLVGLRHLHTCIFDEISYQRDLGDEEDTIVEDVKFFHCDLKPANILVRKVSDGNAWEAAISDFGLANQVGITGGSFGYLPPEKVMLKCMLDPNKEDEIPDVGLIVDQNLLYGQAADIWSMGLIFVAILNGKASEQITDVPIPALSCIEQCLQKKVFLTQHGDEGIRDLTQEQIDKDLLGLKDAVPAEELLLRQMWDLVGKMLQVVPEKRISAQEALEIFETAVKDFFAEET